VLKVFSFVFLSSLRKMDSQELIAFAIANPDQISGSLEYQLSSIY